MTLATAARKSPASFGGFFWGLLFAVAAAALWPELGSKSGPLHTALLSQLGVILVFFLYGARLPLHELRTGAVQWRQHAVIQGLNFVLFPLLGVLLSAALSGWCDPALRRGVFYLCALPATISSAVVLTGLAAGNVSVAIFNSTLSGLLGLVVTPVWMRVLGPGAESLPLWGTVLDLAALVLLPLLLGQTLRFAGRRPAARRVAVRLQRWSFFVRVASSRASKLVRMGVTAGLQNVDRAVVLFIVYTVFCDSFEQRSWSRFSGVELSLTALTIAVLLVVGLFTARAVSAGLGFSRADRVAITFVGCTKSLAVGVPMAQVMFEAQDLGPLLLPIMLYHPLQLLVCAALVPRFRREVEASAAKHANPEL